jgi:hypothetical protein
MSDQEEKRPAKDDDLKILWFCPFGNHLFDHLKDLDKKLDTALRMLAVIQRKEVILMKEVDELVVTVETTKGIEESTAVAIDQILAYNKQILDQIANTVDPAVIAALNAKLLEYNTALATKRDELLAAIPANPV